MQRMPSREVRDVMPTPLLKYDDRTGRRTVADMSLPNIALYIARFVVSQCVLQSKRCYKHIRQFPEEGNGWVAFLDHL